MKKSFGKKVRSLREECNLTREEFCEDESELSVRQLARIETGQSIPNLEKVHYIANRLGVKIGILTDGEEMALPARYEELKYHVLRIPLYGNSKRAEEREKEFDEIFENYYDALPEIERVIISGLQSKFEVYQTGNIDFGLTMLEEYFNQVSLKKKYSLNDLAIIDLYLLCAVVSGFDAAHFDQNNFIKICKCLLKQSENIPTKDLFLLNNVLLNCSSLLLQIDDLEILDDLLTYSYQIMTNIQDFQKMPMYYFYR